MCTRFKNYDWNAIKPKYFLWAFRKPKTRAFIKIRNRNIRWNSNSQKFNCLGRRKITKNARKRIRKLIFNYRYSWSIKCGISSQVRIHWLHKKATIRSRRLHLRMSYRQNCLLWPLPKFLCGHDRFTKSWNPSKIPKQVLERCIYRWFRDHVSLQE